MKELLDKALFELHNNVAAKKKVIIKKRLIELNLHNVALSLDTKFPKLRTEVHIDHEYFFGDDGTEDGAFIVVFHNKPPRIVNTEGKFEYCLDFDYSFIPIYINKCNTQKEMELK